MTPKTRVAVGLERADDGGEPRLGCTSAEGLIDQFRRYLQGQGKADLVDSDAVNLLQSFAEDKLAEVFDTLQAAQFLRSEFHLTPKPPFKWSEKGSLGKDITVCDILGDDSQIDDALLNRPLANLTFKEWWNCFYQEDAEAGRISNSVLTKTDPGFQKGYSRELGVSTLSDIITPPQH